MTYKIIDLKQYYETEIKIKVPKKILPGKISLLGYSPSNNPAYGIY
jgi:hypothetical protein